jgi:ADP-dependent phosphofructokinase/glucokinase
LNEKLQKEILSRIENVNFPDRPDDNEIVDKVKDKFREWDKFKIDTVYSYMKEMHNRK